ncbi:MAG: DUF547 domain-containing protein [Bacteroidetes bacterium]|nr:DUF547 domain-containing protein [Bacteroidota bacterium]
MKKLILLILFTASVCSSAQSKVPSHEIWNSLLKKNVSSNGKVNYKGFIADSALLSKYLKLLSDNVPDEKTWSVNEQKAYWINAYNAFTVKLIIKYYPLKSIKDIGSKIQIPFVNTPWDIKFIKLGNETFDLNNIEHGHLRKKFGDARVHFSLVCASKSCPILLNEAYVAEKLDSQLDTQAKVFLSDKNRNDVSADNPKLSKIFDWYGMDFKSKGVSVIDFINKYSTTKINANAKINYNTYSWDLNE